MTSLLPQRRQVLQRYCVLEKSHGQLETECADHTQGDPPNVCFMTSRVWVFSPPHSLARGQGHICFTPILLSAHTLSDNDSCHSLTAEFQMLKTKAQGFLFKSSQQS